MDELNRIPQILVVEDNPADVRLITEALKESKANYKINVVTNGEDALAHLNTIGISPNLPNPDLIILDLMLPKKSGLDVLAEIKANPGLMNIPVVVLTSSSADDDFAASYRLAANCCIRKPIVIEKFFGVVKTIEEFWFSTVKLPERTLL